MALLAPECLAEDATEDLTRPRTGKDGAGDGTTQAVIYDGLPISAPWDSIDPTSHTSAVDKQREDFRQENPLTNKQLTTSPYFSFPLHLSPLSLLSLSSLSPLSNNIKCCLCPLLNLNRMRIQSTSNFWNLIFTLPLVVTPKATLGIGIIMMDWPLKASVKADIGQDQKGFSLRQDLM